MKNQKTNTKNEKIIISNNALFMLAILLIGINSYTFILSSKDMLTGRTQAAGTTKICIGPKPSLSTPGPPFGEVINGTYNASVHGNTTVSVDFY